MKITTIAQIAGTATAGGCFFAIPGDLKYLALFGGLVALGAHFFDWLKGYLKPELGKVTGAVSKVEKEFDNRI